MSVFGELIKKAIIIWKQNLQRKCDVIVNVEEWRIIKERKSRRKQGKVTTEEEEQEEEFRRTRVGEEGVESGFLG